MVVVAVPPAPMVSNPTPLHTSATGINKGISPFYSCSFAQDLVRDASDGRCLSVRLLALSDIQSAVSMVDPSTAT